MNKLKTIMLSMIVFVLMSGIASAFPSVETKYVGLNKSIELLDVEITVWNDRHTTYTIVENYYKVTNFNNKTFYGSNKLYNGTTTGNTSMIVQRPRDCFAKEYTHIEQVITSSEKSITITTDLRPIWYKIVIPSGLGYNMYYGHTHSKNTSRHP